MGLLDYHYSDFEWSLGEFADELAQLPEISEESYPEYLEIKIRVMGLTKRYIEFGN